MKNKHIIFIQFKRNGLCHNVIEEHILETPVARGVFQHLPKQTVMKYHIISPQKIHIYNRMNLTLNPTEWDTDSTLTYWGRVMHICVSKLTIIGSDKGLSPGRRQAIIWTNAGILLIGPLRTNFSEMLIEIHTFSFKKMHLKMSSGKWRPFCLGLNVLI